MIEKMRHKRKGLGRMSLSGITEAVQDEWFSKPHKRDLVGQSPRNGFTAFAEPLILYGRGLAYEASPLVPVVSNLELRPEPVARRPSGVVYESLLPRPPPVGWYRLAPATDAPCSSFLIRCGRRTERLLQLAQSPPPKSHRWRWPVVPNQTGPDQGLACSDEF